MPQQGEYEIVVGLEVHAQLLTQTKLFCGDATLFGKDPNTQVSAISLGHPGTLPRLNKEAINLAIKLGLACNCTIIKQNYFARKNYFYPDLPKGYQISQHTTPICRNGFLAVQSAETRNIRLNRIHIEEDAGKSLHDDSENYSKIDYNRAGTPLLEIVSEPDIRSAEEAFSFVSTLRKLVRHLQVCDGNMEEGSFRCDVNISVRKKGDDQLGTRVEVKNLNSLRFIKKAIEYESQRLISLHREGKKIVQQTRGFDENTSATYAIRTKEDEDDYRYFPEPDLPPFQIADELIEKIRSEMPPSQEEVRNRLATGYGLSDYDASIIAGDMDLSEFFFELVKDTKHYKAAANWTIGPVKNHFSNREQTTGWQGFKTGAIKQLIDLIEEDKISYGIAVQKILPEILNNHSLNIHHFVETNGLLKQSSTGELDEWVAAALDKHSQKITEYKKGKKGLISLFVGEVMRLSGGRADARIVTEKIIEKIKQS